MLHPFPWLPQPVACIYTTSLRLLLATLHRGCALSLATLHRGCALSLATLHRGCAFCVPHNCNYQIRNISQVRSLKPRPLM